VDTTRMPRSSMLETDVIGVDISRRRPGHYVTWADATPEQRELYVRTGSIEPCFE
jgi:hypothetical protein